MFGLVNGLVCLSHLIIRRNYIHYFANDNKEVTFIVTPCMKTSESTSPISEINAQAWQLNRKSPAKAIELASEALRISETLNDISGKAFALKTLGISNVWLSKNEEAFNFSIEAIRLFEQLEDRVNHAQVCYGLGSNFFYLSDYDNALKWYNECYKINEEIGNAIGMAEGLNGLGTVYYTIEENKKAREVLTSGLKICEGANDTNILPRILDGLGETFYNLKEYNTALEFYFRCINVLHENHSLQQVEAFALDGIGRAYAALGDFEKAYDNYSKSLEIRKSIGFRVGESNSLTNIGKLYMLMGDYKKGFDCLNESLSIAKEIHSMEGVYKASDALAELSEKTNNFKDALMYHKLFHEAREQVRDEKSAQRSKSLEMQFKVERAENEKELLEEKNKELKSYFADIVLLSEIGRKITSTFSLDEIVETVYENVNSIMDASAFGIGLVEPGSSDILFPVFIEEGERLTNVRIPLSDKQRLGVWCYDNNLEVIINDYANEVKSYVGIGLTPIVGRSNNSLIYLPLSSKGKVIGVISVQTEPKNAYTQYHLDFLRSIGIYAAIALEKALIYRSIEQTVQERTQLVVAQKEEIEKSYGTTRLLSEIGQQLTSTLDFESLFSRLHFFVNQLMDANCFGVRIYDPIKNEIDYRFEMEKGEKGDPFTVSMDDANNYSVWCVRNKKEIFINDNLTEYSKYTSEIRVPSGDMPHSLIFYPLMMGERILGVITVQSFERNAYKPQHLDILKTLASYTAIAFENANLYENLEDKVKERTAEVIRQKEIIEVKNKDILDSIQYAKKIQQAIFPAEQEMHLELPQSFVFYKPKDIVSGDFYWYANLPSAIVFAVADCTGHGVPGAFMSAICNDLMNQVIRDGEVSTPGQALEMLDAKLKQLLNKSADQGANDGMDIALCALFPGNKLVYSGAHRPMVIVRDGKIIEYKPSKHSIGGYNTGVKKFLNHEIQLQKDDIIYLFSDGYTDQFGGPKGKKFKYRQLKELFLKIEKLPLQEQRLLLDTTIEKWRLDNEQVDDIMMMGVRI